MQPGIDSKRLVVHTFLVTKSRIRKLIIFIMNKVLIKSGKLFPRSMVRFLKIDRIIFLRLVDPPYITQVSYSVDSANRFTHIFQLQTIFLHK